MTQSACRIKAPAPGSNRGYVHVYTGDGKGKTTAALGLALRAAGSGLRVAITAFMKNGAGGEYTMLGQLDKQIRVEEYGSGCFVHGKPATGELNRARQGVRSVERLVESRQFDLVITGRYAHPDVIAAADLVTEMREVKHYYRKGVLARPGIDM
ncbi:cob(I)yrinic acid a,c-diamide adenosyltransferase [Desulfosarcina widdelii]|uniref:corrinoid adenosyltransferase n=1 Tax=Desulfosarcina widdelii TaxID=947919 RepID=A0A5K7Z0E9_9BACT|nr:cob(I)yrinic acid a,c-diamide adenosyltransferase [Desulfosarcina widdelii]BBO74165.1 cob(I)yrinic acid a,c-diamide adenosyltransferase [Desulfosarcina widdelii]